MSSIVYIWLQPVGRKFVTHVSPHVTTDGIMSASHQYHVLQMQDLIICRETQKGKREWLNETRGECSEQRDKDPVLSCPPTLVDNDFISSQHTRSKWNYCWSVQMEFLSNHVCSHRPFCAELFLKWVINNSINIANNSVKMDDICINMIRLFHPCRWIVIIRWSVVSVPNKRCGDEIIAISPPSGSKVPWSVVCKCQRTTSLDIRVLRLIALLDCLRVWRIKCVMGVPLDWLILGRRRGRVPMEGLFSCNGLCTVLISWYRRYGCLFVKRLSSLTN